LADSKRIIFGCVLTFNFGSGVDKMSRGRPKKNQKGYSFRLDWDEHEDLIIHAAGINLQAFIIAKLKEAVEIKNKRRGIKK
jgi:hypothetical protein